MPFKEKKNEIGIWNFNKIIFVVYLMDNDAWEKWNCYCGKGKD